MNQIGRFIGYKNKKNDDKDLSIIQQMVDDEIILIPENEPLPAIIKWDQYNIVTVDYNRD